MIHSRYLIAASFIVLAACASAPAPDTTPADKPVADGATPPPATSTAMSEVDLALKTANQLASAGNVPAAILRLQQLAGKPTLTKEEKAATLLRLGELSFGPGGYDAKGAVGFFDEIVRLHSDSKAYTTAVPMLASAKSKVASLEAVLANASATRGEKFDALMSLGRHDEAVDLMTQYSLTVGNEPLLAMYQIGYLCDEPGVTGKAYSVTDRDGTVKTLRFCDLGK